MTNDWQFEAYDVIRFDLSLGHHFWEVPELHRQPCQGSPATLRRRSHRDQLQSQGHQGRAFARLNRKPGFEPMTTELKLMMEPLITDEQKYFSFILQMIV